MVKLIRSDSQTNWSCVYPPAKVLNLAEMKQERSRMSISPSPRDKGGGNTLYLYSTPKSKAKGKFLKQQSPMGIII